jgi:hypothetical protein
VLYYHTLHQLRLVYRLYAGVRSFNLFRLEPVFAFSRLTALTGGIFLVLISITYILYPYPLGDIRALASYLLQILLAVLAFILPLWPTHQRLAAEKRRLQDEAGARLEASLQQLHEALADPGAVTCPASRRDWKVCKSNAKFLTRCLPGRGSPPPFAGCSQPCCCRCCSC